MPPDSVARATAVIFSAVPLGSVLGVPVGTLIGDLAGWRTAFVVMGALTRGASSSCCSWWCRRCPRSRRPALSVLGGMLRSVNTRFALLMTFLVVLAHFGTYTYVTPFLEHVTHAGPGLVTTCPADLRRSRHPRQLPRRDPGGPQPRAVFAAAAALIALRPCCFPVLGRWEAGAVLLLIVWGIAYGAVPVWSQTWFSKATPTCPGSGVGASSPLPSRPRSPSVPSSAEPSSTAPRPRRSWSLGGATAVLMVLVVWAHWAGRFPWP